tara:strand:- start:1407 stop:1982 length:576 start_codon:yes stop_codon:yes gene_type:complete
MATTLYISASKLKRDTALGSAVDDNLLTPYINIAQDRQILPALGTELDNYLKTQIAAGTALTGSYLTLVEDYIQPALVQFTFCEVAYVVRLRFSNNSVTVPTSEQGSPASISDIKEVVQRANEIAMFYRERMIDFIQNNTATLPEYNQNTGSDLSPSQRNYFGGLNVYPKITDDNQLKALAGALGIKYFNA